MLGNASICAGSSLSQHAQHRRRIGKLPVPALSKALCGASSPGVASSPGQPGAVAAPHKPATAVSSDAPALHKPRSCDSCSSTQGSRDLPAPGAKHALLHVRSERACRLVTLIRACSEQLASSYATQMSKYAAHACAAVSAISTAFLVQETEVKDNGRTMGYSLSM
jgi:hypothetical protein